MICPRCLEKKRDCVCVSHVAPTDEQVNAAIELLRRAGFAVSRPEWGPWETPMALFSRLNTELKYTGFISRLKQFTGVYPQRRGPQGRLLQLRTTLDLVSYLNRGRSKGRRLSKKEARP